MARNIHYETGEIAAFYSSHRQTWSEFYPSERWIFERAFGTGEGFGRILDVGCAAGGLGRALSGRFGPVDYTGIDINRQAIEAAERLGGIAHRAEFHAGDIVGHPGLPSASFHTVVSLGCADWNVETDAILAACWDRVAPGGRLIVSLRLTPEASVTGRQRIELGQGTGGALEHAPYKVYNTADALALLGGLDPAPSSLVGYGYWGPPSAMARVPYERLVFTVFDIGKGEADGGDALRLELLLPRDVWAASPRRGGALMGR